MMARTQITLEPEMQRKAKQRASNLGISLAEYVRTLVTRDLGAYVPQVSPKVLCGIGNSGGSDLARNKDAMIGEAFSAARKRARA